MTIEEKAKENATKYTTDLNYNQQYMKCGFKLGARWMLEKAMTLIEDSVIFDKFGRPVKSETFRKAMEK